MLGHGSRLILKLLYIRGLFSQKRWGSRKWGKSVRGRAAQRLPLTRTKNSPFPALLGKKKWETTKKREKNISPLRTDGRSHVAATGKHRKGESKREMGGHLRENDSALLSWGQ